LLVPITIVESVPVMPLKLPSGRVIEVIRATPKKSQQLPADGVYNYSKLLMQLGLLFISIDDLMKSPDRKRALGLLKYTMVYFRAHSTHSKYAAEILRLLVHQQCILSVREAYQEFYGLFVNTKGKIDSYIPCDLQMEYLVCKTKKQIKHMFSGQTEHNLDVRSKSIGSIADIAYNFDNAANVILRAKKTHTCQRHGRRRNHDL